MAASQAILSFIRGSISNRITSGVLVPTYKAVARAAGRTPGLCAMFLANACVHALMVVPLVVLLIALRWATILEAVVGMAGGVVLGVCFLAAGHLVRTRGRRRKRAVGCH